MHTYSIQTGGFVLKYTYSAGSYTPSSLPTTVSCTNPYSIFVDGNRHVYTACAVSSICIEQYICTIIYKIN